VLYGQSVLSNSAIKGEETLPDCNEAEEGGPGCDMFQCSIPKFVGGLGSFVLSEDPVYKIRFSSVFSYAAHITKHLT